MASCDDDFSLLSGDAPQSHHHHRHQSTFAPNRFAHKPQNPHRTVVAGEDHDSGEGDEYGDNAFCSQTAGVNSTLFAAADDDDDNNNSNHHLFVPPDDDESDRKSLGARICNEKRKDPCGEDLSDSGGGEGSYFVKKPKISSPASGSADYRKDREEWSDSAIGCLLDAYTDKFEQLNRGNLRGRDWEAVASIVSGRSDKQKTCKSVEQCKNKVDNLKKRYKAERQRLTNGSLSVSHWPWFKKMEQIVGSSPSSKTVSDEDKSVVGGVVATRQTRSWYWKDKSSLCNIFMELLQFGCHELSS